MSKGPFGCEHGRLGCAICWPKMSSVEKARQRGAMHKGYGFASLPPGDHKPDERDAYMDGYRRTEP